MTTQERVRRPLTRDELAGVVEWTKLGGPSAAIIGTFDLLLRGEGSTYHEQETIAPSAFAIPYSQTVTICDALNDYDYQLPALERVNSLLTWMNVGPSSYEEGDEQ